MRMLTLVFGAAMAFGLPSCSTAGGSASEGRYTLDYTTSTDEHLQGALESIDARLRKKYEMADGDAAAGVLDLQRMRLAMIHPDRIEYAASVPKLGILLAYFALNPAAASHPDSQTRRELALMVRSSSNEMATKFSRQIGLAEIQRVLNSYGFYDERHGGGIWVGKHYGADSERIGDPVGDHSHAATVRQLIRFYLMLDQGMLVSSAASEAMREIFTASAIPHDEIKFVKALADREVEIMRKWGSWKEWLHDSALISGPGRRYILVGLTHHSSGDAYLEDLALAVDDLMIAAGGGQE